VTVRFGIDVLVESGFEALRGRAVGAIVNPTSVDARFRHLADLLAQAPGVRLRALFGPEHGVRGEAQYMVPVDDVARDPRTGVPVYSLYGHRFESLTPRAEWLVGLDALVFDLQDVGARYYTYVYTMALALGAAARAKVPFFVLDRPNPLGLVHTEGNLVEEGFRSFVGLYPWPTRHGMTVGELARLLHDALDLRAELHVIACQGLTRTMGWSDLGRAFIPPSPNMPTPDTALVYPGMCLAEGTNVSEGRGTCRPFEQFGAPWLSGHALAQHLEALRLPGVTFRPCAFTPTFDKWKGQSCEGAFLHVTDREAFQPLRTGLAVIQACHHLGGEHFAWRPDAYEFVEDVPAFDLLCGTDQVRRGLEAGAPLEALTLGFEAQRQPFLEARRRYALYP
jgi:uncharacterized protein YbbC (DUF1343 family)